MNTYEQLDGWVDAHFDEQVRFLQELIRVPTDTPPGNNAPHADRAADLLRAMGLDAEKHPVPQADVRAAGLESITNLVVRRAYGPGRTVLLNAHGDVVPPGEGWTHDPYGGEIEDGKIYGRAAAVSKCDFSTYAFAVRALEAVARPKAGKVELLFTYDEEFGGTPDDSRHHSNLAESSRCRFARPEFPARWHPPYLPTVKPYPSPLLPLDALSRDASSPAQYVPVCCASCGRSGLVNNIMTICYMNDATPPDALVRNQKKRPHLCQIAAFLSAQGVQ